MEINRYVNLLYTMVIRKEAVWGRQSSILKGHIYISISRMTVVHIDRDLPNNSETKGFSWATPGTHR